MIYLSFHIDKRRLAIYSLLIYLTYLHNQFSKFILYRRTIDVITYDKSGIGILYLAQINTLYNQHIIYLNIRINITFFLLRPECFRDYENGLQG